MARVRVAAMIGLLALGFAGSFAGLAVVRRTTRFSVLLLALCLNAAGWIAAVVIANG